MTVTDHMVEESKMSGIFAIREVITMDKRIARELGSKHTRSGCASS